MAATPHHTNHTTHTNTVHPHHPPTHPPTHTVHPHHPPTHTFHPTSTLPLTHLCPQQHTLSPADEEWLEQALVAHMRTLPGQACAGPTLGDYCLKQLNLSMRVRGG